jgi:phage-related protein
MASSADAVLIMLIAVVIVGILVAIVLYGGNINNQVLVLSQRFQTALVTVEVQFANLVANAVEIFGGLAQVAGEAFSGFVPKIVESFTAVASYFTDQLKAMIKQVQNNLFGASNSASTIVVAGMQSAGSAFGQVVSQLQNFYFTLSDTILGLAVQAATFVVTFVNAIINQIVNGVASAIVFVVQGIKTLVSTISHIVTTGLAEIPGLIQDVQNFFTGLAGAAQGSLNSILSAIVSFGDTIVSTFQAIPHYSVCVLRCICAFVPLVSCPASCCCFCCPGGNCGACGGSGCCPCNEVCFFPQGCCNGSGCGVCSCG